MNPDGSIYHLNLHPEDVAPTVLTVGDPDRVARVSKHFDRIDVRKQKREFVAHTGELGGKRITVLSSGIGPDNIDIVLNELDALVNFDLKTRTALPEQRSLRILRLGTTGSLQPDIPVDSIVLSRYGIGLDNLLAFYPPPQDFTLLLLEEMFREHMVKLGLPLPQAYAGMCDPTLLEQIAGADTFTGITLTMPGFYGPQGRSLRLQSQLPGNFFEQMADFRFDGHRVTNLEMETGALFALGTLLGHRVLSCNVVLANRPSGTFSPNPATAVEKLIVRVLERL